MNTFELWLDDQIRGDALELPVLPDVATKVMNLCASSESDAAQLARVIHNDQAIAGHVLKVANSALFGGGVKIVSLQQAIARLGMRALGDIAVGIVVRGRIFNIDGYEDEVAAMWRHSVVAGAYAKEIARTGRRNVESAFLCGLLHDVGKPVLLELILSQAERFELSEQAIDSLVEAHHTRVGAALARSWALPVSVCESIAKHHAWSEAEQAAESVYVTALADALAYLVAGEGAVSEEDVRRHGVLTHLNLYPDDLDELLERADQVLSTAEVF